MVHRRTFDQVLDHEIRRVQVAPPVMLDVGLGLSSGIWRAVHESPRPRPAARRRTVAPAPSPSDAPSMAAPSARPAAKPPVRPAAQARWTAQQQVALQQLRRLGAEISEAPDLGSVKRAWRRLCRRYHPDVKATGHAATFCGLQDAWEVLKPGPLPPRTGRFEPLF